MLDQLTKLIREYKDDDTLEVNEKMTLSGDLGLSSLDFIQLGTLIEEDLHIRFSDRDIKDIRTDGDGVRIIERLKN